MLTFFLLFVKPIEISFGFWTRMGLSARTRSVRYGGILGLGSLSVHIKKVMDFYFLSDHLHVVKLDNKKVIWRHFYFLMIEMIYCLSYIKEGTRVGESMLSRMRSVFVRDSVILVPLASASVLVV